MINSALEFIRDNLENYLESICSTEDSSFDRVALSQLVDSQGKYLFENLGITLINIQEETTNKAQFPYSSNTGKNSKVSRFSNPELKLNLYVLISSNFQSQYDESLKFISYVIQCFQKQNVFTALEYPELKDDNIEKLILDLQTLDFDQMHRIWTGLNARYLPSVIYKARMLVIQDQTELKDISTIKTTQVSVSNMN